MFLIPLRISTPMKMRSVTRNQAGNPRSDDSVARTCSAYETFGDAASTHALKVLMSRFEFGNRIVMNQLNVR